MATASKLMTMKSVKGIAATLSSDLDVTRLKKLVMDSLQQSPQIKMQEFSPRAMFLMNISSEGVQKLLNDFLERLSKYYCTLLIQKRSTTKCDKYATFQIHWLQEFLQVISMDTTQKGSLPVSLNSTELGGQIFPLVELIPFVKQIVYSVRREINGDTFKRYGDRLFQVHYMQEHITLILYVKIITLSIVIQVTEMKLQCT